MVIFLNTYCYEYPENALFNPDLIPENSTLYSIPNAAQTIYMADRFYWVILNDLRGLPHKYLNKLDVPWESTEEALSKARFLRSEKQIPKIVLQRFKDGKHEPDKANGVPYGYIQRMTDTYFAEIPQQRNCLAVQKAIKGEFQNCLQIIDPADDIVYTPLSVTMRTTDEIPVSDIPTADLGKKMVMNGFCSLYHLEVKVYRKFFNIMDSHYEYEYNYFLA